MKNSMKALSLGLCSLFAATSLSFAQQIDNETDVVAAPEIFVHPELASKNNNDVGIRLVCLFDSSGSIDQVEYDAQIEAMASALESKDFQYAVSTQAAGGSIALCVVEFSGYAEMRVPWLDIRKGEEGKFKKFAKEIRSLKRGQDGPTNTADALTHVIKCLDECPWKSKRTVVDVITDGADYAEKIKEALKVLATRHEATLNSLITIDSMYPKLDEWAQLHLRTTSDYVKKNGRPLDKGFSMTVGTQVIDKGERKDSFFMPMEGDFIPYKDAMRMAFLRKVIMEVAQVEPAELRRMMMAHNDVKLVQPKAAP